MTDPANRKTATRLLIISLVIFLPLLFYPWDNRYFPRSLKAFWDLGHVGLFAVIFFIVLCYRQRLTKLPLVSRFILAAGFALLAGGTIEIIQYYLGRDASFYDLSLDVLGAVLAVSWYPKLDFYRYPASAVFRWFCTIIAVACLIPTARYLYDEYSARQDFPVLADFSTSLQATRFGNNPGLELSDNSLRVYFTTEQYSGFGLRYFPRNWSGYREVVLEIYNPGEDAVELTCRIHDLSHNEAYNDRYNRQFHVPTGHQEIRIDLTEVENAPKTRRMNMDRIGALGCFTTNLSTPAVLIIQSIFLR